MRWPWVSASVAAELRNVIGVLNANVQNWHHRAVVAEERNERLVRDMLAMRREGFVAAPKAAPVVPQKASPSDEAISMRAGSNGQLRRYLSTWRDGQKALGVKEDEMAERILRWQDPDDETE